jgi:hypothetical protein
LGGVGYGDQVISEEFDDFVEFADSVADEWITPVNNPFRGIPSGGIPGAVKGVGWNRQAT